jgi:lactoylglutathione lyase
MMFQKVDYVMVMVSDMKRSVAFYRDALGLQLKFESKDWTEFQTGATTLALHGGGTKRQSSKEENESKYAGTCSIGFNVENLEKTFEELKGRGIVFVMPPTGRSEEGIRLAVALDPDDLPISFAEPARQNSY